MSRPRHLRSVAVIHGASTLGNNASGSPGSIFPPEPEETMTVTFNNASMEAQSKSERKNCCSGDDLILASASVIELTGYDTDPDLQ